MKNINKSMPAKRSVEAISLRNFHSSVFHDRREDRDKVVNENRDYFNEYLESLSETSEENFTPRG